MALVTCSECKKEMSDSARACPSCGYKKSSLGFGTVVMLITLVFIISTCASEGNKIITQKPAEKTPEQIASDIKFNRDVGMLRAFKKTLHNPSSFKIESVIRMADDSLCVQYRATNKFNALILSQLVILKSGQIGAWDTHCAGKSGEAITYIKGAL